MSFFNVSAPMVYVRDNNASWVLYDIVRDYQGSITHLVDDSDGTVVAEYSYDPWGRMRDPGTVEWSYLADGSIWYAGTDITLSCFRTGAKVGNGDGW